MARSVKDSNLETRSARNRLAVRKKPYWKMLDRHCCIGYYRGIKGGSWVARRHLGNSQYKEQKIGQADDIQDPDGVIILSFYDAQAKAREWYTRSIAQDESGLIQPKTIGELAAEYLDWFKSNRKSYHGTLKAIELNILPQFQEVRIHKITTKHIQDWLNTLATTPRRVRRGPDNVVNYAKKSGDPRARKSSANRQLNIFKAILNYGFKHGYIDDDKVWRRVKPFKGVESPRVRFLSYEECKRLINASDLEFRPMVKAALLTGARYGELCSVRVQDFNSDNGTLFISESKSNKPRYIALNSEGLVFFTKQTAGLPKSEHIFKRNDGSAWRTSHQIRRIKEACSVAKINPAIGFHVLRHTYASLLAMKGVTLQVIAKQLGHADTRICEKHYAHLCPNYIAETIREKLPEYGINDSDKVLKLG